jgi:uncharacterized membrane protein YGL010W
MGGPHTRTNWIVKPFNKVARYAIYLEGYNSSVQVSSVFLLNCLFKITKYVTNGMTFGLMASDLVTLKEKKSARFSTKLRQKYQQNRFLA